MATWCFEHSCPLPCECCAKNAADRASETDICRLAVTIKDTQTGGAAIYQHETQRQYAYENGKFLDFWWSEGNGACDCNRGIFFDRARDQEKPDRDGEDYPCGDGRYAIVSIVDQGTGETVYSE